jgi:hypothetical protein
VRGRFEARIVMVDGREAGFGADLEVSEATTQADVRRAAQVIANQFAFELEKLRESCPK